MGRNRPPKFRDSIVPYLWYPHNPSGHTRHSTGAMRQHSSPNADTQRNPASPSRAEAASGTKAAPARSAAPTAMSTAPRATQGRSSDGCPQCARPAMQITVWIDRCKRRLHDGHGHTRWRSALRA